MTRRPPDVALAATLHDPGGRLLADIRRGLPRLAALYRGVAVATTPPTAAAVKRLLDRAGAHAGTPVADLRGPVYRAALRGALATGAGAVHYLDFDRVLRWARRRPRELRATLRLARRHPVLVVGRTPKAHRSHQLPLYATEVLVNRLIAERLGLAGRIDFLAPSFVLARDAAARLLARSRARDATIYGELASLLVAAGREVAYVECRGLDWETPDYHRRAIARVGLAAWRRRWDTPGEWALRTRLAAEILRGCARGAERYPAGGALLRRLPPRVG